MTAWAKIDRISMAFPEDCPGKSTLPTNRTEWFGWLRKLTFVKFSSNIQKPWQWTTDTFVVLSWFMLSWLLFVLPVSTPSSSIIQPRNLINRWWNVHFSKLTRCFCKSLWSTRHLLWTCSYKHIIRHILMPKSSKNVMFYSNQRNEGQLYTLVVA